MAVEIAVLKIDAVLVLVRRNANFELGDEDGPYRQSASICHATSSRRGGSHASALPAIAANATIGVLESQTIPENRTFSPRVLHGNG